MVDKYKKDLAREYVKYVNDEIKEELSEFGELLKIADAEFARGEVTGYLSSTLIYHQIFENLISILGKHSNLYLKIAIYPRETHCKKILEEEISFFKKAKHLRKILSFQALDDFVNECIKFNKNRNKFVHKLLKIEDDEIGNVSEIIKISKDKILGLFVDCYNEINDYIEDVGYDLDSVIDIQEILGDELINYDDIYKDDALNVERDSYDEFILPDKD